MKCDAVHLIGREKLRRYYITPTQKDQIQLYFLFLLFYLEIVVVNALKSSLESVEFCQKTTEDKNFLSADRLKNVLLVEQREHA